MKNVTLVLEDGTKFQGKSFGYEQNVAGEVVFNTAMTGYPEVLTDAAYAGQIVALTYPLVGNYGTPTVGVVTEKAPELKTSEKIYAKALIVTDYSPEYSHWNAKASLADWLVREKVTAVTGIDTRQLAKTLREKGVMGGKLVFDEQSEVVAEKYDDVNYVAQVSCTEVVRYNEGAAKKVVVVDCGVKDNFLRCLIERGVEVIRVPWNYDYTTLDFDGVFIGNGPGNPNLLTETIDILRKQMAASAKPVCGICLGHQLLALAAGGKVTKMKYGHHSANQPVREAGTEHCVITSQNHGYAVDAASLGGDWTETFVNMNDGTNEGLRHNVNPWMGQQFQMEAYTGSEETEGIFDQFIAAL